MESLVLEINTFVKILGTEYLKNVNLTAPAEIFGFLVKWCR
jgi:hypothetical protein